MSRIEAILFDLGNVVLEVDFRRTFRHWAESAGVHESVFYERWSEDDAYRAHETGALDFDAYVAALADRLGVSMSLDAWLTGWNEVFVGPYPGVQAALRDLPANLPLYAFTNTNPTHEAAWRARYGKELEHFEEIFVSSSMGLRKPDKAAFEWVTAAMDLAPERILFLDDNPENVAGAERAGLTTVRTHGESEVLAALEAFASRFAP
jgi:putative hydrolase of the HAD superfamily